jgi:hypothetical protein
MRELEIAKIEEAKSMPTIQVLDEAVPAERRKAKGTIRRAGLAGIVAFVAVAFLAVAREYLAGCEVQQTTPVRPPAQGPFDPCVGREEDSQPHVARVTDVATHAAAQELRQVELSRDT